MEKKLKLRKRGESSLTTSGVLPRNRLKRERENAAMQTPTTVTCTISINKGNLLALSPVTVKQTESVTFENDLKDDIFIQFQDAAVFGVGEFPLPVTSPSSDLTVRADAPLGIHRYSVFCPASGKFAKGNSMPIIIVTPK